MIGVTKFNTLTIRSLLISRLISFRRVNTRLNNLLRFLRGTTSRATNELRLLSFAENLRFSRRILSALLELILGSEPTQNRPPTVAGNNNRGGTPNEFAAYANTLRQLLRRRFLHLPGIGTQVARMVPVAAVTRPPGVVVGATRLDKLVDAAGPTVVRVVT